MNETELERLVVRLQGDSTSYQKMVKEAQKSTQDLGDRLGDNSGRLAIMSQRVNAFGLQLRGYGLQMAAVGAGVVGVGGLMKSAFEGVQIAARNEATETAFKSLIGNVELAQATLKDLRKFAAETPFEQPEILAAAKQMLAFGTSAEEIVPTMQTLGDVASALDIPLGSLTYLFGTLKSQGRAFMVDINQFAMRGIPIWDELGKQFGVGRMEMRELVEQGKVGFPEVEKAFNAMTSAGGRFHGGMQDQSQTLLGLFSTMRDNINTALGDVGKTIVKEFGLKELVTTVGDAAGQIASALQSISPETKKFLASLVGGGVAAAAIVAAIIAIKVGVAAIVGMFAALGPFGIAMVATFAAVSVGVAAVVNELGGVGATLEFLKQKATEAWEWLAPVRQAIGNLAETVTGLLASAWESVKQAGLDAWNSIFGGTDINWDKVKSTAVRAILLIEFSLLNFGKVAEVVWKKVQYDAVRTFNTIVHLVSKVLPAAVLHAVQIIPAYWERLFNFVRDMAVSRFEFVVATFKDLQRVLSGEMGGGDFIARLTQRTGEEIKKTAQSFAKLAAETTKDVMEFKMPERQEGEFEKSLREEHQRALKGVQQDFDEFVRHRAVRDAFRNLFRPREGDPAAGKGGPTAGIESVAESAKNARKEVQLLDATLTGSSESRRRLQAHVQATLTNALGTRRGGESGLGNERANGLLAQISDATRNLAERTVAVVEASF